MADAHSVLVLSDVHYAAAEERARGSTELQIISNPLLRIAVRFYRHVIWRRDPFAHNHWLERFIQGAIPADLVIANGDYSCDTAFVGVSDPASLSSARECLDLLRQRFDGTLLLTMGDHELGKTSLFGGRGGMRLESLRRAETDLGIKPFWTAQWADFLLLGVTSSLVALPIFQNDALPEETAVWEELREQHLAKIREALRELGPEQRFILFCHDPTALPFLWHDPAIRAALGRLEATVIGHLHSRLFLWKSRLLSGFPTVNRFGKSVRRMSAALHEARLWRNFRVVLCPALGGIELLRDGGYLRLTQVGGTERPNLRVERYLWKAKNPRVDLPGV